MATALALVVGCTAMADSPRRQMRVAADPNNLPFSNDKREGFENRIVELVAREMNAEVQYVWRAQRRGFFREALKNDDCDVIVGAPTNFDKATTTTPYYRSTYVFVARKDRKIAVRSFDDRALKSLKIGVQVTGDANTPPAQALGRRGIVENVVGFSIYGDYAKPNPPAAIVDAVAKGEVDVAVVWGPLAGYFAKKQTVELALTPVREQIDGQIPMTFEIAMAVKKRNFPLRDELNGVLARQKTQIQKILDEFGVPRVEADATTR
jgi:mxaJ protein